MPAIMTKTANVTGSKIVALNPTYHKTPRPVSTAPHPRTIERGAPYGLLLGGMMMARRASQAPKIVKTRGKAAANVTMLRRAVSIMTPRMIRKTPRLRGAQGRRIAHYHRTSRWFSLIVLSPESSYLSGYGWAGFGVLTGLSKQKRGLVLELNRCLCSEEGLSRQEGLSLADTLEARQLLDAGVDDLVGGLC